MKLDKNEILVLKSHSRVKQIFAKAHQDLKQESNVDNPESNADSNIADLLKICNLF